VSTIYLLAVHYPNPNVGTDKGLFYKPLWSDHSIAKKSIMETPLQNVMESQGGCHNFALETRPEYFIIACDAVAIFSECV
jgi:hypothetical protein